MTQDIINPMPIHRRLSRPPIREAVIEWRFIPVESWSYKEIDGRLIAEIPEYTESEYQRQLKMEFKLSQENSTVSGPKMGEVLAILKRTPDMTRIAQFHPDRVIFSHLRPYPGWETFVGQAMEIWDAYERAGGALVPTRIGVRFINSVETTGDLEGFSPDDILSNVPSVPETGYELSRGGLVTSELLIHEDDPYFAIRLNRSVEPKPSKAIDVILDVDAWVEDPGGLKGSIRDTLEVLRQAKNDVFFASLGPRLLEALA